LELKILNRIQGGMPRYMSFQIHMQMVRRYDIQ
jgi:hypothetical protein